jgi:hypothetical protein
MELLQLQLREGKRRHTGQERKSIGELSPRAWRLSGEEADIGIASCATM